MISVPGEPDRYPARDEVIAYLTHYAKHFERNVAIDRKVTNITKEGPLFLVGTESEKWAAKTVIAATGAFAHPFIPELEGLNPYKGTILHSSQFKTQKNLKASEWLWSVAVTLRYRLLMN